MIRSSNDERLFGKILFYVSLLCFFSVCLLPIFLFPVIKINTSVTQITYNVFEFVKTFSAHKRLWDQKVITILNCCYAFFAIAGVAIVVSVYSVIRSIYDKEGHMSILMLFVFLALIIIATIIIVEINKLNAAGYNLTGANVPVSDDNYNIGVNADPMKNLITTGAAPIFLMTISLFLVVAYLIIFGLRDKGLHTPIPPDIGGGDDKADPWEETSILFPPWENS